MSPNATSRLVACIVSLLVLVAAGCGLSTNDEPEDIADTTIDSAAHDRTSTFAVPYGDTEPVVVWFLATDDQGIHLRQSQRRVAAPPTAGSHLDALFQQPPDDIERDDGIWTAIPSDASLLGEPVQRGGVLVVDLPEQVYLELHGRGAQGAFAQIAYTATELPGIDAVQFERDGTLFSALDGSGQATTSALGRDDFADFAPVDADDPVSPQ